MPCNPQRKTRLVILKLAAVGIRSAGIAAKISPNTQVLANALATHNLDQYLAKAISPERSVLLRPLPVLGLHYL